MGYLTFLRQTVASVVTPGAGKTGVFVDSATGQLAVKNDSGISALLAPAPGNLTSGGLTSLTGATASINTVETVILSAVIPANSLRVGSTFRFSGFAQCSGSTIANGTVTARIGTAGTTADTAIIASGNLALVAATTGVTWDGLVTLRSTGVSGTAEGSVVGTVSGVADVVTVDTATHVVNTTVQNTVTVTLKTSAGTNSLIAYTGDIVVDQA